jgi:hypothetical protein
VVEHFPHHPKCRGSSPAAMAGTGREYVCRDYLPNVIGFRINNDIAGTWAYSGSNVITLFTDINY